MTDLRDLYQEVILEHSKRPRNFGELGTATHHADGHNPLCGDTLSVALLIEGDRVTDVRFTGSGCAISRASASLMTTSIKGRSLAEVETLFGKFHDLLTVDTAPESRDVESLGKLQVFAGVKEFPMRVKCATLAWHTLRAALDHLVEPVTTE